MVIDGNKKAVAVKSEDDAVRPADHRWRIGMRYREEINRLVDLNSHIEASVIEYNLKAKFPNEKIPNIKTIREYRDWFLHYHGDQSEWLWDEEEDPEIARRMFEVLVDVRSRTAGQVRTLTKVEVDWIKKILNVTTKVTDSTLDGQKFTFTIEAVKSNWLLYKLARFYIHYRETHQSTSGLDAYLMAHTDDSLNAMSGYFHDVMLGFVEPVPNELLDDLVDGDRSVILKMLGDSVKDIKDIQTRTPNADIKISDYIEMITYQWFFDEKDVQELLLENNNSLAGTKIKVRALPSGTKPVEENTNG
jgi:hypothetical protein